MVRALVTHDANATNVRQHREVLPARMLAVPVAGFLEQLRVVRIQFLTHDGVGILQDFQLFRRDIADDANGQTWAGEGLAPNDVVGQSKRRAQRAYFVFEEMVQRLDKVEGHAIGEGD